MTAAVVGSRLIPALDLDAIACIVHEALRAYSAEIGESSGVPWEQSPRWQRYTTLAGVSAILCGDVTSPQGSHGYWCECRKAEGWQYGPTFDESAKTHPCLVPWGELSEAHRRKDVMFFVLVEALTQPLGAA